MRFRRIILAVSLLAMLFAVPAAAKGPAGTSGACPNSPKNFKPASNVFAYFTTSGLTDTYFFSSLTNENPVNGVPGLVKYCVYPSSKPKSAQAIYDSWIERTDTKVFSFVRPGGNSTNIPLDGTEDTEVGIATWTGTLPDNQTILLHIADPKVCASVYPGSTSPTCFVLPSAGPICDDGDPDVAYNANPFDVLHCPKFALGFEADSVNELGDEVTPATSGTGVTLKVVFASYACQTSGHWNTGDCVSQDPPGTYTFPSPHVITGNIYSVDVSSSGCDVLNPCKGALLGSATGDVTQIPFRPSADSSCTGADAGKFVDPLAAPGAQCKNAVAFFETFSFPSVTLTSGTPVIWTVAFDTTNSGYDPIINDLIQPTCTSNPNPGCGWDALNVGYEFYSGAPYSGTDVNNAQAFESLLGNTTLHVTTTWPDTGESGRPLGEITIP